MHDARSGDGTGLVRLADSYIGTADFGVYFAVNCLDARWPDVDGMLAAAKRANEAAPHFGEALVNDYVRCSLWPVPPDPVPPPSTGEDLPPVLVISTVGDPATPYESGVAVADHLATGVLLTYEGDGHTDRVQRERLHRRRGGALPRRPASRRATGPAAPPDQPASSPATSGSRVSSGCSPASRSSQ